MSTQPATHQYTPTFATARTPAGNARRRGFGPGALLALVGLALASVAQMASAAIPATERQVLMNIYTSTNGATWTTNTGWNGAAGTECTWFGITCDSTQSHVITVSLGNKNLTGTLPALTGLTRLADFVVSRHESGGQVNFRKRRFNMLKAQKNS